MNCLSKTFLVAKEHISEDCNQRAGPVFVMFWRTDPLAPSRSLESSHKYKVFHFLKWGKEETKEKRKWSSCKKWGTIASIDKGAGGGGSGESQLEDK